MRVCCTGAFSILVEEDRLPVLVVIWLFGVDDRVASSVVLCFNGKSSGVLA